MVKEVCKILHNMTSSLYPMRSAVVLHIKGSNRYYSKETSVTPHNSEFSQAYLVMKPLFVADLEGQGSRGTPFGKRCHGGFMHSSIHIIPNEPLSDSFSLCLSSFFICEP